MDANKGAEKLRRAAQREARAAPGKKHGGKADAEGAEAHPELTHPELSKGRPAAVDDKKGDRRPSNAGTDGP